MKTSRDSSWQSPAWWTDNNDHLRTAVAVAGDTLFIQLNDTERENNEGWFSLDVTFK
jgi:hypothetical protein